MTDFAEATRETSFRGLWNTRIPLRWYINVCRRLKAVLGSTVTFYLVTDGSEAELGEFINEFAPLTHFDRSNADISNLLIMARADVLVCSISSYSEWAAFLSTAPYIWYSPHLTPVANHYSIWGYFVNSPDKVSVGDAKYPRGIAAGDEGSLPAWLFAYLRQRRSLNTIACDLVNGGGIPQGAV
jgi:hypothetical protein